MKKFITILIVIVVIFFASLFIYRSRFIGSSKQAQEIEESNIEELAQNSDLYFEFSSYDTVLGSSGPKLLFYIDMVDRNNHLIGDWFRYLSKFADEGLIQFSVRATNDKQSYAVDQLASDELTHEELSDIQDYLIQFLNCIKVEQPPSYFQMLNHLSQQTYSNLKNVEPGQKYELNSMKAWEDYIKSVYSQIDDANTVEQCMADQSYIDVIASEERFNQLGRTYPLIVCADCDSQELRTQSAEFVNTEEKSRVIILSLIQE